MVEIVKQPRRLTPLSEASKVDAILSAIGDLDLDQVERLGGWGPLKEISSATIFDGLEGSPSGVFQTENGGFEVSATAYVTLQYGGRSDHTSMSDSYPAVVKGRFDGGKPVIERIEVDNSSFYE